MDVVDSASALSLLKPGQSRAALAAMKEDKASLVLCRMSPAAAAAALNACTADELAALIKAMPLELGAVLLQELPSGQSGAALSSKILSHELSSTYLHSMRLGVIPKSQEHVSLLSHLAVRNATAMGLLHAHGSH